MAGSLLALALTLAEVVPIAVAGGETVLAEAALVQLLPVTRGTELL
jgi:hypothetical protein